MDRLLETVRRALGGATPCPAPPPPPPSSARTGDDLVAAFGRALESAGGRLLVADDAEHARRLLEEATRGKQVARSSEAPSDALLEAADVGLDEADLLIAETGTVVTTPASRACARTTLVPPLSIYLAGEADLVRDLPEALARLAPRHREGRATTLFVTGPSRTADIEKQLVVPAHGPREVLVLLTLDRRIPG